MQTKNQTKKSVVKRILTYCLGIIGALGIILTLAIAIVLNTVFTPSRLTPLVLDQARNFLKSDIEAESVDLTFFSSFPEFKLHIRNGYVGVPSDTLIRFEEIGVGIHPLKYLTSHQIHIGEVAFKNADIRPTLFKDGKSNWDILKADSTQATPNDTTKADSPVIESIKIDKIAFENVGVRFRDEMNNTLFELKDFSSVLTGDFGKINNELDITFKAGNILFIQDKNTLVKNLALSATAEVALNTEEHVLQTRKMVIDVNGIKAGCGGFIKRDTVRNEYMMDIKWGLNIPSLTDALQLIPTSIVKEAADVRTTGDILVTGSLKGTYGNGVFPVADLKAVISDGSFHYKEMPYGIEELALKADGYFDLNQKSKSRLTIGTFTFKGASSKMFLSANIDHLFTDPLIDVTLNTDIDFTSLAKSFPLENNVKMEGIIDSKLKGKFNLSSIKNRDLGKLGLEGYLKITDTALESPADSFFVNIKSAGLAFGTNKANKEIIQGKNLLNAIIGFDGVNIDTRMGIVRTDSLRMQVKSSPLKDTTAIASMEASIAMKEFWAVTPDSMSLSSGKSKLILKIQPSKADNKVPLILSNLKFDKLAFASPTEKINMTNAGFDLSSQKGKQYKKQWISEGKIGFGALNAWTQTLPLPISMPTSVLALRNDELILENAGIKIGKSDMRLTGKFTNLAKTFYEGGILKGNYSLTSSFIDCNELMNALKPTESSLNQDSIKAISVTTEKTDSTSVFVVPDKIDFTMQTRIDKVLLGQMVIENIDGAIEIRNQTIELEGLKMHTLAADMISTLVYRAKDLSSAYTGFDVKMKDIQVGKLVELMPALDTLVPMLRSLDGIVNFHIAAETRLDHHMSPIVSSVQGAANLRGDSLVLMDGETFSEISKMLRFKNKERNIIDSVSVDMIVRNGQIEIYPFKITMDRYMAAVGGKHNLDMSFNYHVSLLQSPIPFKIGVDVRGNLDDFKFRITKPKYKNMHEITRKSPVDSTSVTLRQRIKRILQKPE